MAPSYKTMCSSIAKAIRASVVQKSFVPLEHIRKQFQHPHFNFRNVKGAYEHAFLNLLTDMMSEHALVEDTMSFLTVSIKASRMGLIAAKMPASLMYELSIMVPFNKFARIFEYMEVRIDIWMDDVFYMESKGILAEISYNVMSQAICIDQERTGRALLFLAQLFSACDKDMKEFALERVLAKVIAKRESTGEIKAVLLACQYKYISNFQNFFNNPLLWENDQFTGVIASILAILITFQETPCIRDNATSVQFNSFNLAMFLSSDEAIWAGITSITFRHHILMQILCLLNGVRYTTTDDLECNAQKLLVRMTNKEVYNLLSDTVPKGYYFNVTVIALLNRPEFWLIWKAMGCNSLWTSYNLLDRYDGQLTEVNVNDYLMNDESLPQELAQNAGNMGEEPHIKVAVHEYVAWKYSKDGFSFPGGLNKPQFLMICNMLENHVDLVAMEVGFKIPFQAKIRTDNDYQFTPSACLLKYCLKRDSNETLGTFANILWKLGLKEVALFVKDIMIANRPPERLHMLDNC